MRLKSSIPLEMCLLILSIHLCGPTADQPNRTEHPCSGTVSGGGGGGGGNETHDDRGCV